MVFSRAALAFTLAACLLASRSAHAVFQACSSDEDCNGKAGFRGFTCVGAENGAIGLCKCGSRTDPCTKNFSCGTQTLNDVKSSKCMCGGSNVCPWGTACADDGLCRCTKSKALCNTDTVAANGGTTLCLLGSTCTAVCPKGLTLNEAGSACVKAC